MIENLRWRTGPVVTGEYYFVKTDDDILKIWFEKGQTPEGPWMPYMEVLEFLRRVPQI